MNARKTLLAGFTTVRDVGSADFLDVGLRNAINAGVVPGPRTLVAVHALGATGGHCDDGAGLRFGLLNHEMGPEDGVINSPDQARFAVRFNIKYGADVIKTCATGGVLSPPTMWMFRSFRRPSWTRSWERRTNYAARPPRTRMEQRAPSVPYGRASIRSNTALSSMMKVCA